jgi:hypothetical protein
MSDYKPGPYTKPGRYHVEFQTSDTVIEVWEVIVRGITHQWTRCIDRYEIKKPKPKVEDKK